VVLMAKRLKIRIKLTNRYAEFLTPYPDTELKECFSYIKPGAYFNPYYRNNPTQYRYHFLKYDRVPSGLFLALKDQIEKEWAVRFDIDYQRKKIKFEEWEDEEGSDRKYQNECVLAMRKASKVGGIILAATGTGKTYIAAKYFHGMHGTGVFIVDELGLLAQARDEIAQVLGESVGMIGNMKFKPARITVATVQTLQRHRRDPKFLPWMRSLKTVIIDELHEMLGKRNHDIVSSIEPLACFGLTATLQMQKKIVRMRATALTGPVIYKFPYQEGLKRKYLSPAITIALRIKRGGHAFLDKWEEYDKVIAKSSFHNDIVERLIRYGIKRKRFILQLVKRPKHVRILSKRLKDIPHKLAYGAIKVRDRIAARQELENKTIPLLIANQVFKKGTNIKRIDMIIDAAGLPNENDAQQKLGRGVRLCDGKRGLIYIDVGFINPAGVTKDSYNWNRFAKAAKKRKRALARLDIPVYEYEWNGSAKDVIRFAERKLEKLLAKLEK